MLPPYTQSMPFILLRAREAMMARIRPILGAHGLTEQQWRVLRLLDPLDEVEVTRLAALAFLHPPSLTRILRDLGARDLVARRQPANDRRRGMVSITAAGRALIEAAAPALSLVTAAIGERFGTEPAVELARLLAWFEAANAPPPDS